MLAEKRKKMNVFHIHKASNFLAVFAACLLQALRLTWKLCKLELSLLNKLWTSTSNALMADVSALQHYNQMR